MLTNVSNIKPGSKVYFHNCSCFVLEHRARGILLITEEQIKTKFGNDNNFAESYLCEYLNNDFLDKLTDGHPEEVLTRTVDLTAVNGSKEYERCECKVAPLTLDEVRRYHGLLPKPEKWEWSATPWSTPCVDGDDRWVMGLRTDNTISGSQCCSGGYGVRPAFLINHYSLTQYEISKINVLDQYTTKELIAEVNRRMNETN